MDVKFVTVLVVLAVMVSQTSQMLCPTRAWNCRGEQFKSLACAHALFPGAFDCCIKISDEIPKGILRRVERFEIQKADGLCHLDAVILHIKGKKFCVNPLNRKVQKMMKKMKHKIHRSKFHIRKQRRTRITKEKEQKQ